MPNERNSIDIQRLIAEVAARHNVFLRPSDPAIALVTMNRLILDDAMETVHGQIRATIAEFHASMQKAERRAGSMLAQEVKESAAQMQWGLQNDIHPAGFEGSRNCASCERGAPSPRADSLVRRRPDSWCPVIRRRRLVWDHAALEVWVCGLWYYC